MSCVTSSSPLYAWYGDDFTGSTDVLEALALHGVPAVLFTAMPGECDLAGFAHCHAIGIAGESRSRTPAWMDEHLPGLFARLQAFGARVNHYKVCSTFDSSPQTGNIGRAMEIGAKIFHSAWIPVVAAAPRLGRYVIFSNLFARSQDEIYRIDRHPTMRCHPVTPMDEADLRRHLARQTHLPLGSVDMLAFFAGRASRQLSAGLAAGARGVVFDGLDAAMLQETASLIWRGAADQPAFAVGSSGLTYGLLSHWRAMNYIGDAPSPSPAAATDRLLVLSGSCSPVTAQQIQTASRQGFTTIRIGPEGPWTQEVEHALATLARGGSVVLYTALGSPDQAMVRQSGTYGEAHGRALGEILRDLLLRSGVRRIVIAGGDTSTHGTGQLGLKALTFAAPLAPGAPLCRAWAPGSPLDGLELVLKGGQIGPGDFFARVRDGGWPGAST